MIEDFDLATGKVSFATFAGGSVVDNGPVVRFGPGNAYLNRVTIK